jgi:ribosomal protein S18 acetylase RimI-like enzyme
MHPRHCTIIAGTANREESQMTSLPRGLITRPPTVHDVQSVTDLINLRSIHDLGRGLTTVARVLMYWEEPGHDLSSDDVLVIAPDEGLIAYAGLSASEEGAIIEVEFAVHPNWSGQGIEEHILGWAEARARERMGVAPADEPVTLEVDLPATNELDQQRLIARGYTLSRVWLRMAIALDAAPPPPDWPPGISVRTFQPDEANAVHAAWEDAQRDEWGFTSLTEEEFSYYFIEREEEFDPTLWFLAIDDATGDIVGYVLCRWSRPGSPAEGHVRYIAVRQHWRRRGIARALLLHAFAEFRQRGKGSIMLGVDATSLTGADRLYRAVGMRQVDRSLRYRLELRA